MEHRAVRRRAAGEVVALHDALEALAAAGADDVDALAVGEDASTSTWSPALSASPPVATFTSRRTRVGGTLAFL